MGRPAAAPIYIALFADIADASISNSWKRYGLVVTETNVLLFSGSNEPGATKRWQEESKS